MTQLRSFLLLSNIPLYICTTSSLSITFSYVFSWRWHLKWEFEPLGWFTQFAWISPIYSCYSTLFYFLLLSCSMSISFLGQPEDPRSIQAKSFLPNKASRTLPATVRRWDDTYTRVPRVGWDKWGCEQQATASPWTPPFSSRELNQSAFSQAPVPSFLSITTISLKILVWALNSQAWSFLSPGDWTLLSMWFPDLQFKHRSNTRPHSDVCP